MPSTFWMRSIAAPDKLCINIMGDAAIGMTGMDIETAARNGIAILTIVFSNGIMAAERDVLFTSEERYGALTVGGNYTKVAEGLGVEHSDCRDLYECDLALIRPDQHVAWRGNSIPEDCSDLLARVTGW